MDSELVIDHGRFLAERRERRRVQLALRRSARKGRGVSRLTVLHDDDGSCCRRRSWGLSAQDLVVSLARDGERVAWQFGDALLIGDPDGEEKAEQLRRRLRELGGGRLTRPGPMATRVRDRVLLAWYEAGARRCLHFVSPPDVHTLMPQEPSVARCTACWVEYAAAHAGQASERGSCDSCGRLSDELGVIAGPWYGVLFTFACCPECLEQIEREVEAA